MLSLSEFLENSSSSIESVLQSSQSRDSQDKLTIVLGNEACDLDSIASSILMAHALANLERFCPESGVKGSTIVPVLNIPREDLFLRQDGICLLQKVGLDPRHLTFMPDLKQGDRLRNLEAAGRVRVVLVDHNALSPSQQWLAGAVCGVVDHHEDAGALPLLPLRVVHLPAGSCVSLVARLIADAPGGDGGMFAAGAAEGAGLLAAGPLLLDTDLLRGKVSDDDRALYARLFGPPGPDGRVAEAAAALHAELLASRSRMDGMSSSLRLRKDYKRWGEGPDRSYGIATVPCSLQSWLADDSDLAAAVRAAAAAEGLKLYLVMLAFTDSEGRFARQLLVHSPEAARGAACGAFLLAHASESLRAASGQDGMGLAELEPVAEDLLAFSQANVRASRKQVQPAVEAFVAGPSPHLPGSPPST